MIWLAYTQARRFERCGELARQWKEKLVKAEPDQKKFFVGRVVHTAFERWLTSPDRHPLIEYLNGAWAHEEAALADKPMALRWVEGERQEAWVRAQALLVRIEADASGLLKLTFHSEQRFRHPIVPEKLGMYAQPDVLGEQPEANVLYVVELKSGTSYDPEQVDWYTAVHRMNRAAEGLDPLRYIAVALRPAMETSVATREVTVEAMAEQIARAHAIGTAMLRGEWAPRPQAFCSMCEGRDLCPDYQAKFGALRAGQVSFR